ncbi:MAG: molybdate ABC transporter permease subunit, partial [Paracoccus sp. (in: a-proteobacteria)]
AFLQVPGGEGAAVRLVLIAVAIAMGALFLSEALSRAVARRIGGG